MTTIAPARAPAPPAPPAGGGRLRTGVTWAVGVILGLVLIGLLAWISPSTSSTIRYAPDNPGDDGARAVAQILGGQGVQVQFVQSTAAALADARPEGTLLIIGGHQLRPEQQQALAQAPGDVVLAGLGPGLAGLTDAVEHRAGGTRGVHLAHCREEHAVAAEQIEAAGPLVTGSGQVEPCFGPGDGTGRYASWEQHGAAWRVFSTAEMFTNAALAQEGNAALVLRALGQQPHLTWYIPAPDDPFGQDQAAGTDTTMPLLRAPLLALFTLVLGAMILWRGRRLGPVLTEPLPVVVRATETTRGRGRLYRRHQTHAHAGTALRAGTVARVAAALGLPRWANPEEVAGAIARATGRSPEEIDSVLYSPPPHDEAALALLAEALDTMESEVHRR